MNLIQVLILAVIEGASEFLPISSTGHLILATHILALPQTNFLKSFEIIIQFGAILAVVFIYFRLLLKNLNLIRIVFVSFLPSALLGFLFYDFIKNSLLGNELVTVIALIVGGFVLLFLPQKEGKLTLNDVRFPQALLIGLVQCVSMVPGVSRSASTIIGGIYSSLTRRAAVEFSFLLAVPTMFAATVLDLVKQDFAFSLLEYQLLGVGLLGAFISALITVNFLLNYVKNNDFKFFGFYRILAGVLYWVVFIR